MLAGCGGSGGHKATRAGVIAQANAACSTAQNTIRAIPSPASDQGSLPALASYLRKVTPVLDSEVASLRKLPRPAAQRSTLNAFIAAEAKLADGYRTLAAAARRGDQDAVTRALSELQNNRSGTLAGRYGLRQCTGLQGTVG